MRELIWSLGQDIRSGWRGLRRDRAFGIIAAGTLALGIGTSTTIYALVDRVLVRPLPYDRPDELVSLTPQHSFMRAEFDMARERLRSVSDLAGYQPGVGVSVSTGGEASRVIASLVSANLFSTLRVPVRGQELEPQHELASSGDVVIISHRLWQTRFGGEETAIGRSLLIDGSPHVIIGIAPERFAFPDAHTDLWLPVTIDAADLGTYWGIGGMRAIGRLTSGAAPADVQVELRALGEEMRLANPFWTPLPGYRADAVVLPLHEVIVGGTRTLLLVLMGAVALVWLIACANVANLMIARGIARARELAVRMALGAERWRIVRQLMIESLTLAMVAGAAGAALSWAMLRLLAARMPADLPRISDLAIDVRVLLFTAAVTVLAVVLVGVAPALRAAHGHPAASLGDGSRSGRGSRSRRLSSAVVVAEVALAVVLVAGAGLLLRTLANLARVETGLATEQTITARLSLPTQLYRDASRRLTFYGDVLERIRQEPGVHDAALTRQLPFDGELSLSAAAVEFVTLDPNDLPVFELRAVTPSYFRTIDVPVMEGRAFTDADRAGGEPVAIIDRVAAEQFWPGESPIGRRIGRPWLREWRTIVGVVGSVRNNELTGELTPELYVPLQQEPPLEAVLVLRTAVDVRTAAARIRAAVASSDATVPVSHVQPYNRLVSAASQTERLGAWLVGTFAGLALLLGAIGLYGVLSYAVGQRSSQLSLRSALGATRPRLLWLVLREGLGLALIGLSIGVPAAIAAGRVLRSVLFGVQPNDAQNLVAVTVLLLITAAIAALVPALRALRTDPAAALRG